MGPVFGMGGHQDSLRIRRVRSQCFVAAGMSSDGRRKSRTPPDMLFLIQHVDSAVSFKEVEVSGNMACNVHDVAVGRLQPMAVGLPRATPSVPINPPRGSGKEMVPGRGQRVHFGTFESRSRFDGKLQIPVVELEDAIVVRCGPQGILPENQQVTAKEPGRIADNVTLFEPVFPVIGTEVETIAREEEETSGGGRVKGDVRHGKPFQPFAFELEGITPVSALEHPRHI